MNRTTMRRLAGGMAVVTASVVAGCGSWERMDRADQGTTVGGAGGAIAGAVVGGPIGAVVGGGVGAYVGNQAARSDGTADTGRRAASADMPAGSDAEKIRAVQRALNERGFDAGPVDGQTGPATEDALRRFQQASGLAPNGRITPETLSALGL